MGPKLGMVNLVVACGP